MKCTFCGFASGKIKEHRKGYPFNPVKETKHSLCFLSLDSPVDNDAHLLVIPKKHYKYFHQIPKNERSDLMELVSKAAEMIQKKHGGYNLLLNNGHAAGQRVYHVHFHIIPRDEKDKIEIEVWERSKITPKRFAKLCDDTRKRFKT